MRAMSIISVTLSLAAACGNPEEEGRKAAEARAAAETKAEVAAAAPAVKLNPPVAGGAKVPCAQLLDAPAFTEALAEVEPLSVKDITQVDAEAAAVCALIRGGVRPDQAQQAKISKKNAGRLGTLPGDELCRVTAYCWTIETDARFRETYCKSKGLQSDESMGSYACLHINAVGADDVYSFTFFDEDTKCLLKVNGGPSMVDNDLITTCAKTARDLIGKPQIAPGWIPLPPGAENLP
jgi:hypothetical protein